MSQQRNPKPKTLEYRFEDQTLFGKDPADQFEYKIRWCSNGSVSHYTLDEQVEGPSIRGWYVYVNEKDSLYLAIDRAWHRFYYNVEPCPRCKKGWVNKDQAVCYNCKTWMEAPLKEAKHEAGLFARRLNKLPAEDRKMVLAQFLIDVGED
jgi:hypothetical protein